MGPRMVQWVPTALHILHEVVQWQSTDRLTMHACMVVAAHGMISGMQVTRSGASSIWCQNLGVLAVLCR